MKHRRGGVLVAVLLSLLVAALVGLILMISFGVRIARRVHVTESHGKTVVETPVGSLTVRQRKADPRLLGIPVYPGAAAVENDDRKLATIELELGDTYREFSIVTAEYTTGDDSSKVVEYYRAKLPSSWIIREKRHGVWEMRYEKGGYKRVVAVRERGGLTHITLASVGEPASN